MDKCTPCSISNQPSYKLLFILSPPLSHTHTHTTRTHACTHTHTHTHTACTHTHTHTHTHTYITLNLYAIKAPPTIDAIEFEVKSQVTTLACISSVSPATTVKWMRDEQPLTIDGTVYEQTQILIDRKESIYRTVLIVNDQQDNILDHTYTCSVNNILGTATDHVKITKRELYSRY